MSSIRTPFEDVTNRRRQAAQPLDRDALKVSRLETDGVTRAPSSADLHIPSKPPKTPSPTFPLKTPLPSAPARPPSGSSPIPSEQHATRRITLQPSSLEQFEKAQRELTLNALKKTVEKKTQQYQQLSARFQELDVDIRAIAPRVEKICRLQAPAADAITERELCLRRLEALMPIDVDTARDEVAPTIPRGDDHPSDRTHPRPPRRAEDGGVLEISELAPRFQVLSPTCSPGCPAGLASGQPLLSRAAGLAPPAPQWPPEAGDGEDPEQHIGRLRTHSDALSEALQKLTEEVLEMVSLDTELRLVLGPTAIHVTRSVFSVTVPYAERHQEAA
ncbi:hypothetical protein PAPYR_4996 [Paratrimastix pyriformis]|uniref:Uncharacterized protein n=1 Tax=Paratrimastix pyriformis TaxID=342808 RepID=A0ABQ8UIY7_9EUKA|nr:hypothetical protein PAPYR_4996 [Paratrimastix pyriformis]